MIVTAGEVRAAGVGEGTVAGAVTSAGESSDSEASTLGSEEGSNSDDSGGGGSSWELPRRNARVEAWLDLLPLVMPRWLQYTAAAEHYYAAFNLTLRVAVPMDNYNKIDNSANSINESQTGSHLKAASFRFSSGATALETPAINTEEAGIKKVIGVAGKPIDQPYRNQRFQGNTMSLDLPVGASLGDLLTAAASAAGCAPEDITSLRACGGAPGTLPVTLLPMPSSKMQASRNDASCDQSVANQAAADSDDDSTETTDKISGSRDTNVQAWLAQDLRRLGMRCSDVLVMTKENTSLPFIESSLKPEPVPFSQGTAPPAPPANPAAGHMKSGKSAMHSSCVRCGNAVKPTELCRGCYLARYCGDYCQRLHWPDHREACLASAAVVPARCAQGHTIVKTDGFTPPKTYTNWQCDKCQLFGTGPRWWCQPCRHNLFFECPAYARQNNDDKRHFSLPTTSTAKHAADIDSYTTKEVAGAGCCFCPLCGGAIAASGRALRAHVASCDGVDSEIAAQEAAKAKVEAASNRWRMYGSNSGNDSDSQAANYTGIVHERVGLGSLAQLSSCDMKACGHSFWKESDTAPRNMARLERDIGFLLSGLPLSPHGSIFMAQDSKRLQYMKALVIGPVGSPYEQGTCTHIQLL